MMKIHTTQNLISQGRIQTTNPENIPNKEIRFNKKSTDYLKSFNANETPKDSVAFKGKKKIVKVFVEKGKKAVKEGNLRDRILNHDFFGKTLDFMNHEVLVQSAISCIVCVGLRPLTIMAIPTKKSKEDNMYASAHSVSSGLVGLAASFIIATPFSKGVGYAKKNLIKNLKPEVLKKMFPNVDINSIWADKAKNLRKPMEEWKDVLGNKFSTEYKKAALTARPKHISDVSGGTLKALGADIDLKAMKGKPINEWVDRSGNKLHLDTKDMFLAIKEEGMGTNFFSIKNMDDKFLQEVFPNVDIKTVNKDGSRLHPDNWKNIDGSDFKLNLDDIHISSYRETADATPIYSGLKRKSMEKGKEVEKYVSYQTNNGDKLGTPILEEYISRDRINDIVYKTLTWLPDIITRPVVATSTIALIPLILKKVFHLEKHKKPQENQQINQTAQNDIAKENQDARKVVA